MESRQGEAIKADQRGPLAARRAVRAIRVAVTAPSAPLTASKFAASLYRRNIGGPPCPQGEAYHGAAFEAAAKTPLRDEGERKEESRPPKEKAFKMKILLGALGGGLIGWIIWWVFQKFSPQGHNQLEVPDLDAPALTPEAVKKQRKEAFAASGVALIFIGYVVFGVSLTALWLYGAASLFFQQRLIESAVALVLPPIGMGYGLLRLLGWW